MLEKLLLVILMTLFSASISSLNLEARNYVADPADGGTVTLKSLMEVFDETTNTYVISFQGDPRYTSMKFTISFLPGPSADTSTLTWFSDYTPVSDDTPPPDNLLDIVPHLFENFSAHAEEHLANQAPEKHLLQL